MYKNVSKRVWLIVLLLMLLTLAVGCTSNTPAATATPPQQATQTAATVGQQIAQATATATVQPTATAAAVTLPTFTAADLAKFDGQNGNPAYIAVSGKVYDVTNVPQWKTGTHVGIHKAGVDQTAALAQAPHSADLLGNVPIVGLYQ